MRLPPMLRPMRSLLEAKDRVAVPTAPPVVALLHTAAVLLNLLTPRRTSVTSSKRSKRSPPASGPQLASSQADHAVTAPLAVLVLLREMEAPIQATAMVGQTPVTASAKSSILRLMLPRSRLEADQGVAAG